MIELKLIQIGRECLGIGGDPMETDGRGRVICRGFFVFRCGAKMKERKNV